MNCDVYLMIHWNDLTFASVSQCPPDLMLTYVWEYFIFSKNEAVVTSQTLLNFHVAQ